MDKYSLRKSLLTGIVGVILLQAAHAGKPVWTFTPVAEYPASVTVSATGTATVQYNVTNQSHQPHTLKMQPIQGITPSGCDSPLGYQQSCALTLAVNGSALKGDVIGGPILCDQGNANLCYQPSQANSLAIRLTQAPPTPPIPPIQQYTVTPSASSNGSITPSSVQTVNSGATLAFTATPNSGYGVDQWLLDGSVVQTGGNTYQLTNITANHTVNVTFGAATLTPSVSSLALAINCQPSSSCTTTQDIALTGNSRYITIQNTGSINATNVAVTSNLPSGTNISTNTCTGTITPGNACVILVSPGSITSSDANNSSCTSGTAPVANTVTVTADGGLSTTINIYVLSYGCVYQGGFIYAVEDQVTPAGSIGGKVVTLTDQAAPRIGTGSQSTSIIWSSNGVAGTVNYTSILGIDDTSTTSVPSPTTPAYPAGTPAYTPCDGSADGACNSNNIRSFYNYNRFSGGSAPTPLTYYAAGLCSATINTYSDWYLPAYCELNGNDFACPNDIQTVLNNLSLLVGNSSATTPSTSCTPPSGADCLAGIYWSSTEVSGASSNFAIGAEFTTPSSSLVSGGKAQNLGVRCSRALTF